MKRSLVLLTIAMLCFGGFVGYTTNYTNTAMAHEPTIPRFVDVPRTNGFDLNINLNKQTVTYSGAEQGVNVIIQHEDSIVYVPQTKEITKYVKVREIPPYVIKSLRRKPNVLELCDQVTKPNRIQH